MKVRLLCTIFIGLALGAAAIAQDQDLSDSPDSMPLGGRNMTGTVTEVGQGFVTVKTHEGETYTVNIGQKTRLLRQGVQPTSASGRRTTVGNPGLLFRPGDLKVGDLIAPMGEVDDGARTVNALVITILDPTVYKQMEASSEKIWVTGEVKAMNGGKVTIQGSSDHAFHVFQIDRGTVCSKYNQRVAPADIKIGDTVHVDAALKGGAYVATSITAIPPRVHPAAAPPQTAPQPQ